MSMFVFHSFENNPRYYFVHGMTCAMLAGMLSFNESRLYQWFKNNFKSKN